MRTYPIMLNLRGRPVLVVGAGPVGQRKVRALLAVGAAVTWLAPDVPVQPPPGATVVRRAYRNGDAAGMMLVFACTDDRAANAAIAADGRLAGALANAADQPDDCDFFSAATIDDGDVVVAVGTGGSAPHLAAAVRDALAAAMPADVGAFAAALDALRGELRQSEGDQARRTAAMRELADLRLLELYRSGGIDALRARMRQLLSAQGSQPAPREGV
jgi:siroheme synthase-like protein